MGKLSTGEMTWKINWLHNDSAASTSNESHEYAFFFALFSVSIYTFKNASLFSIECGRKLLLNSINFSFNYCVMFLKACKDRPLWPSFEKRKKKWLIYKILNLSTIYKLEVIICITKDFILPKDIVVRFLEISSLYRKRHI